MKNCYLEGTTFEKRRSWHPDLFTSWQRDREKVETVSDFIFLGSKINAEDVYSHEIKRCLLLGIAMTNLNNVLKTKDITLLTKVCIVKAMVSLIVMYRCENWTMKKAEYQRIKAFELQCWRRPLRSLGQQGVKTSQF